MAEEVKLGNPAVVGLAGFGMTTLILQFHNLGLVSLGPVIWIGLLFGGSAQLVAGLLEFKTGNNFGFCAFTGYGAFWISLCLYLIFGTNADIAKAFGVLAFDGHGLGIFLLMWTFFTFILFIASMKHHTVLALLFLTLLLGFTGLDLKELAGIQTAGTLAALDLIVCALLAWYLMAVTIYAESGIKLPVGSPWL
ncbi:MAG: acetate uptake transporter [Actinomycetota bacterium]|nr:acetate uptake transporter [Actinomycetota bacterium]